MALTQVDQGLLGQYAQYTGFKNRIINGGMQINQRGGTISASGTVNTYGVDRFAIRSTSGSVVTSMQQSTVAPTGFYNSLLCTVTTADTSLAADDLTCLFQRIEGVNVPDLNWGTLNAQPVTLSFWVRSNLTGTYGVGIQNNDGNRSYPSTYTISAANTWEYKTITIPGDTSGTWNLGTTSTALYVFFGLSAGSNFTGGTNNAWNASDRRGASGQVNWGATLNNNFYITGVQLEEGSTATSFDYRPYGTELYLCQRYFWPFIFGDSLGQTPGPVGWGETTTTFIAPLQYPQTMRATPTITTTNSAIEFRARYGGGSIVCSAVPSGVNVNNMACWLFGTVASGITVSNLYTLSGNNSNVKLNFSAEL